MLVFLKKNRIKKILRKQNDKYRSSYSHLCYSKLDSKLDYVAVLSMNLRKKCDKNDGFNKLNFEEKVVCLNYSFTKILITYFVATDLFAKTNNLTSNTNFICLKECIWAGGRSPRLYIRHL